MDLITSLRALGRHWVLTSFLLLVTLAGAAAVAFVLPWTYQAQSTVVLLPSRAASQATGNNPYLAFDASDTNTAYLLGVEVTGPTSGKALAAAGDTGTYTVGLSPDTNGPVLVATVTAPSKSDAERTIKAVTTAIGADLHQLQVAKGIKRSDQIQFQVVAMSSQATLLISKKAKTLGLALALGLFLTFGVPLLIDGRTTRRQQEREAAAAAIPARWTGESGNARRAPPDERQARHQVRDESALAGARRPAADGVARSWTE
jgi:hypothetical protein